MNNKQDRTYTNILTVCVCNQAPNKVYEELEYTSYIPVETAYGESTHWPC